MNNNSVLKTVGGVLLVLAILVYNRLQPNAPIPVPAPAPGASAPSSPSSPEVATRENDGAPRRDLEQDERHHGHTLQRHIARTDEQLIERLREETNISSASTYSDKETAERCVGIALEKNKAKIDAWLRQPSHENLEVDYIGDGKTPIGRSIHHGSTHSVPCYNSKVILKQDGRGFYVLTSYPEGR